MAIIATPVKFLYEGAVIVGHSDIAGTVRVLGSIQEDGGRWVVVSDTPKPRSIRHLAAASNARPEGEPGAGWEGTCAYMAMDAQVDVERQTAWG